MTTDEDHDQRAVAAGTDRVWSSPLGWVTVRALFVLLLLILAGAVVYALSHLLLIVVPVVVAALLAAAIHPLVGFLRRRGVPLLLATWIAMLASVLAVAGAGYALIVAVSRQWPSLVSSADQGLSQLEQFVANGPLPVTAQHLRQARQRASSYIADQLSLSDAFSGASLLITLLTGAALMIIALFFFLKDGPRIWPFLIQPFRGERHARAERAGHRAVKTMGGYVRGITVVALIDAVAIGIILAVVGVPLVLPLATIIFLGAYVPVIGATLSGLFAVLVALVTSGPQAALIVLIGVLVVQQLEGNVLHPLIMGHTLQLHPLVVLLVLTAGTVLAGIIGAVLAVPVAAVLWTIVTTWNHPIEHPPPAYEI